MSEGTRYVLGGVLETCKQVARALRGLDDKSSEVAAKIVAILEEYLK